MRFILETVIVIGAILKLGVSESTQQDIIKLTDLFFENLKEDLAFSENIHDDLPQFSKNLIEKRVENFVNLLSRSQNTLLQRGKRDVKYNELQNKNQSNYIRLSHFSHFSLNFLDDIKFFRNSKFWYMSTLQNGNNFSIYTHENNTSLSLKLSKNIEYTTNLEVVSLENSVYFVIGNLGNVNIFEFFDDEQSSILEKIQSLDAQSPHHLHIWYELDNPFLAVTSNDNTRESAFHEADTNSNVRIYEWKGKHFDLVQQIPSMNVRKTLHFEIYGQQFLVLIINNSGEHAEPYSEIFKQNLDSQKYELHQKLRTSCDDLRYFRSFLNGEEQAFLITSCDNITILYKFVESYFLPFQILEQNDDIHIQPVQDKFPNTALLGFMNNRNPKAFLYDDWIFSETEIFQDPENKYFVDSQPNIIHNFEVDENQFLVISCKNCTSHIHIFTINFTQVDELKIIHSNLLHWCENNLNAIESRSPNEILVGEALRGDLNEEFSQEKEEIHEISAALSKVETILYEMEQKIINETQFNETELLRNILIAENIIFNAEVEIKNLTTKTVNDIQIENILANKINIRKGFENNEIPLECENLVIEDTISPKTMNGVNTSQYLTVFDDMKLENIEILGNADFQTNLIIENTLNGVKISQENLILNNVEQKFDKLNISSLSVDKLNTKLFNKRNIDEMVNRNSTKISYVDKMKVQNITIGGYLNGISVPVLNQKCLKKTGDQSSNRTFYFDELHVDQLIIKNRLNDQQIPDDFVYINGGDYSIDQDVEFLKGIDVNKLEVLKSLNAIEVNDDGNLDVLLKNSSKIQLIPVKKDFENVVLLNPIKLRNKVKNKQMDEINPIKLNDKNYQIVRDIKIEGNVDVRRFFKVADVFANLKRRSIGEVLDKAVKLTDTKVPVGLHFAKPLVVEEIFAEKISNMIPENWLLKNSEHVQYIQGTKRFLKDLSLQGSTAVEILNGFDTVSFEDNIFKVDEDQEIAGNWELETLVAENGTLANHIDFGRVPWENIITINSSGTTTIFGNMEADFIDVKHFTEILGLFNENVITDLLKNVATITTKFKIFGHKEINNLYIKDLTYLENNCVKRMLDSVTKSSIELDERLFIKDIVANDVIFEKTLNNITKDDFMKIMSFGNNQTLELDEDVFLDSLMVDGEVFIENAGINNLELRRIEKDTVKIDENHSFRDVTIESNVIAENNLKINGNIENLDIENTFYPDFENFLQDKLFLGDINIIGHAHIDGLINNSTNLTDFCAVFDLSNSEKRNLRINGNVIFAKGKGIRKVNDIDIETLAKNVWIIDERAELDGTLSLKNGVFENTLKIQGLVNNLNLSLLSENYFSKSKNEKITGHLIFEDAVVFEKNVSTPELGLTGKINGISLDNFLRTVLLNGVDQVFEETPYFEEVSIEGVLGGADFFVNNLNLASDVMRYDQNNVVTGNKIFENLDVEYLKKGRKNITIQDVDLHDFIENAVLKNGTFKLKGKNVFNKAVFHTGLSVKGQINSKNFTKDEVFLKNFPQTITGEKLFDSENMGNMKFKSLKVEGSVNGVNVWDMAKSQAKKSDLINIDSGIEFRKNLFVKNIVFDDLYNNINVSDLLKNVSKLEALENYVENYGNLLNMSLEIEASLKNKAKILIHLKDVRYFFDTYESFGLETLSGYLVLLTFGYVNGTNYYRSFEWVPYMRDFVYIGEYIESYEQPYFMKQIKMYNQDFLYIEHYNTPLSADQSLLGHIQTPFIGRLLQLSNASTFIEIARFPTNGTLSLVPMTLPGTNEECLAFVERNMLSINILCSENRNHQSYYLFDKILLDGVSKISTLSHSTSSYIFALIKSNSIHPEPHVVILAKSSESQRFELVQAIFEAGEPTAISATVLNGEILFAVTYTPTEVGAVDLGRVSMRMLDQNIKQFLPWQYIPLTTPMDVSFMSISSQKTGMDDPFLLVSTNDVNSPLFGAKYDGLAGFKLDFQGKGLPTGLKIKVLNGNFILTLQPHNQEVILLKAECRGHYLN